MAKGLLVAFILLLILEGIAWFTFTTSQKKDAKLEEMMQQSKQSKQNIHLTPDQVKENPKKETTLQESGNSRVNVQQKEMLKIKGSVKEFDMTGRQFSWEPSTITVKQGDKVKLHIKSEDVLHGIVIPELGVDNTDISAGETRTVEFTASKKGRFEFLCATFCGNRHIDMTGVIIVE